MSKETNKKVKELKKRHPKEKLTAFDVVYKVITVALAVAVFPIAYFKDLIYLEVAHTGLTGSSSSTTYEALSVSEASDLIEQLSQFTKGNDGYFKELLSLDIYRPAIIAAVFFVIALLIAIAIIVVAIVSRKVLPVICLSGASVISMIISYCVFTYSFAKPVINGDVTLADLLNTSNYLISVVIGVFVGNVSSLRLDDAFVTVFFLLLAILVWAVSVQIVNLGEEKEKKSE